MQQAAECFELYSTPPELITIKTTLYDLIEAVNDAAHPGEERLVTAIVLDLLDSYRSEPLTQ